MKSPAMLPTSLHNSAEFSHVPSNDGARMETDLTSLQMTSAVPSSTPNFNDMEVDFNFKETSTLLQECSKIHNRRRVKPAPTLATGRRNLKDEKVTDEEARKRGKRRDSNKLSAQRSREKRASLSLALEQETARIVKMNEMLKDDIKSLDEVIQYAKEKIQHTCSSCTVPFRSEQSPQAQPVTLLTQPMSASSCGSECPVSNTSQGLTPPHLNEEIIVKHSPEHFENQVVRPNTLTIPTTTVPSGHSYLDQLGMPDGAIQPPPTSYYQSFPDTLTTPVINYAYTGVEFGSTNINVMAPITDNDSLNLP